MKQIALSVQYMPGTDAIATSQEISHASGVKTDLTSGHAIPICVRLVKI